MALSHAVNTGSVFVAMRKVKQNILKGKQAYLLSFLAFAYALSAVMGVGLMVASAISFFWNINYLTLIGSTGVIQRVIGKEV